MKKKKYQKPKLEIKKIKINYFYSKGRYFDSMNQLMGVDVLAQGSACGGGSSSSTCNVCVIEGTKISTPQGSRLVETINTDELIYTFNTTDTSIKESKIVNKIIHYRDDGVSILNNKLSITGDHPIYSKRKQEWIAVKDLKIGDFILDINLKEIEIKSIEHKQEIVKVYTLMTEQENVGYFAEDILIKDYHPADSI